MGAKVILLADHRHAHPGEPVRDPHTCAHGVSSRNRRVPRSKFPLLASKTQTISPHKSPDPFAGSRQKPKGRPYGFALLVAFVLLWTAVALGL